MTKNNGRPEGMHYIYAACFLSFRVKRKILMINHIKAPRFLTFVRNDIFPYYDTAS